MDAVLKAFDENPTTSSELAGEISFDRVQGDNVLILLMDNLMGAVTVTQYDEKGRQVSTMDVTTDYASVPLAPKAVRISLKGHATLFEAIQR